MTNGDLDGGNDVNGEVRGSAPVKALGVRTYFGQTYQAT